MKILLDENMCPGIKKCLKNYGFDVKHIYDLNLGGISDQEVFKLSQEEGYTIITQNGKDFIVYIPPKGTNEHEGLIWCKLRNEKITRANSQQFSIHIANEFKPDQDLHNEIYKVTLTQDKQFITEKSY